MVLSPIFRSFGIALLLGSQFYAQALRCSVHWHTDRYDMIARLMVNVETGQDVIENADIKSLQAVVSDSSAKRGWRFRRASHHQMTCTVAVDDLLKMNQPTEPLRFSTGFTFNKLLDSGVSPVFHLLDASGNRILGCESIRN